MPNKPRRSPSFPFAVAAMLAALPLAAQHDPVPADLAGTWFSTRGTLEVTVDGDALRANYGDRRDRTLRAELHGRDVEFSATEGEAELRGTLALDASGHRLSGAWRSDDGRGEWRWWRHDPATEQGKAADVAGYWRTGWGMLELAQKGDELSGGLGA